MKSIKPKANRNLRQLFIFCIIAITFSLHAQNQRKIDSLLNVLKTTKQDTTKVNACVKLCKEFQNSNPDTAMYFGNLGLKLSIKANYRKGLANCYINIGVIHNLQGSYEKALECYFMSVRIFEEYSNSPDKATAKVGKKGIANYYGNVGNIYQEQESYDKALEYYLKALKIYKEIGDKEGTYKCYICIGVFHDYQAQKFKLKKNGKQAEQEYDSALDYYSNALKILEESGDNKGMADCYENIGVIYQEQESLDKAIEYQLKSLKIYEKYSNKNGIINCYINIGEINDTLANSSALNETQRLYYLNKAIEYETKTIEIAKEINDIPDENKAAEILMEAYKRLGNFKKYIQFTEMFIATKNSMFKEEETNAVAGIEAKYQYLKKQKEIQLKEVQLAKNVIEIKHQKTVKFGFIGGFVLVALLAFLILWNLLLKKRDNKIITAEKAKSDELLLNILPSETAEELKKYGRSDARPYEIVSVLFTDFEGFTEIAEKLSADKLVAELDLCFRAFDQLMGKYNVEKIKTIGDSYMCAGGIPVPNNTNGIDVVKCGLEIQQFMETYKEERIKRNEPFFEIRIGIHTGPIVAGIVGISKFSYDIWGDTVNIASRMESSGEVGKVNISGATYELVKDNFVCTYRGKIQAKNKGEIDMYFVEGIISKETPEPITV